MREIELKFKVDDEKKLIDYLEKLGCSIGEELKQEDTIYVKNIKQIESKKGSEWLRIRRQNDYAELNYKKQSKKIEESQEIEFGVDSYENARLFLEALGYKKWVEVNKVRRYSKYLEYNICIDNVERLGSFIEIEKIAEENDEKDYIDELKMVAEKLGLNSKDIVKEHYDTMISKLN